MIIAFAQQAHAQHDHHHQGTTKPANKKPPVKKSSTVIKKDTVRIDTLRAAEPLKHQHSDTLKKQDSNMLQHQHSDTLKDQPGNTGHQHSDTMQVAHNDHSAHMPHAFSRNLPMTRNGSGTSWMPDASPMYGYMMHSGEWNLMVHGGIFPRYTAHDIFNAGERGDEKFGAPNWFMLMANREAGKRGLFNFNLMMSLDALTEGGEGYPLLFQSGETFEGKALVDRQHPHDLFDELSVSYTHMINRDVDITLYAGYPGEPALGPPAFMHRVSAENNADAPLSHHWQDPTHITFGVATLGLRYKKFKLEGSSFTGREPDENRYNFDKPRFDSYGFRLLYNPSENWAMQVSNGFIKSPETIEPGINIRRTTASVIYAKQFDEHRYISHAAVWGVNSTEESNSHSLLFESNYQYNRYAVYGRYEYIQKSAHELVIEGDHEHPEPMYNVNAFTLGANRIILEKLKTQARIGLQGTFYKTDERLNDLYGKYPVGASVYLRLNPAQMKMQ
jgi:hypothetical protein